MKLAYIWRIDDYLRVDELPGGRGYADVVILTKRNSPLPPMIVELKRDESSDAPSARSVVATTQPHLRG